MTVAYRTGPDTELEGLKRDQNGAITGPRDTSGRECPAQHPLPDLVLESESVVVKVMKPLLQIEIMEYTRE